MDITPCVYIMSNRRRGTFYVGVTSDLVGRVGQHKSGYSTFVSRYKLYRLVYFERHGCMEDAILREKRLKRWRRDWKIKLIESTNPMWRDLWSDIT